MCSFIDTMFLKRFCLPHNTNLDDFVNNNANNKCVCGKYFHASCIFQGKYTSYLQNILSYGINKYVDVEGTLPSIHAEHDAILRLPNLQKKRKLVKINLIVIRFSKTYKMACSKPCINCIRNMIELPQKKGYKIVDIYYSENDETIIKTSINKLSHENNHFVSSYYRNNRHKHRHNKNKNDNENENT
jgi:cytidine deaminase